MKKKREKKIVYSEKKNKIKAKNHLDTSYQLSNFDIYTFALVLLLGAMFDS
jgi:hypothetical protein